MPEASTRSTRLFLRLVEGELVVGPFGTDAPQTVVSSLDELAVYLLSTAEKAGVRTEDLSLTCSSSVDFPDEYTSDPSVIELCNAIRGPDWDRFLGPQSDDVDA